MPTHILDTPDVTSFQTLTAAIDVLDEGPRQLLIFTGIAASRWDSAGSLNPLTVIVRLGRILPEAPKENDWTATVGLSNLVNKDSDFLYALNAVSLDTDPKTSELRLIVDIAVQGDGGDAALNSFTFQVTVLTEPPKIELNSLLVSDANALVAFAPSVAIETGLRWTAQVSLKAPPPRNVDVFLAGTDPTTAPLLAPGDPSAPTVRIAKGETFSSIFTAVPTFNSTNLERDVTISAALDGVIQTAVVRVTPVPN